jgi:hypothetical protein
MLCVASPSSPPPDPDPQRDSLIVAHVVALVHARRKGDYLKAANAHRELERLGVLVRFPRQRKGVRRDD